MRHAMTPPGAVLAAALLLACPALRGLDWPTYRGDCMRSGATAAALPDAPVLLWTYRARHAPRPAWQGRDTRMSFDHAYHPVCGDGLLFFGSSSDGKVYALDAATGRLRWEFLTGGPVRFAPAFDNGRLFVASDDGRLYCLAAADGTLRWKIRGGPTDSMILGNDRMISRWPVRGGPAVADGVVYFAAGIWPSEGIFLYAVDAATGTTRWLNDSAGHIVMPQPHAGAVARSGVSAQGYLALDDRRLLVPTGRGVPAAFDRATGRFLYFHLQAYGQKGGADICVADRWFINGGLVYDTQTGAHLRTARSLPAGASAAFDGGVASWHDGQVKGARWAETEVADRMGRPAVQTVLEDLWSAPAPHGGSALIKAGDAFVSGGPGGVCMVRPNGTTAWSAAVDGDVLGLAACGGRLLVSTDKGDIYCFGRGSPPPAETPQPPAKEDEGPLARAAADEIIARSGVTAGFCLDLDCGDGRLSLALARRTALCITAIAYTREDAESARRRLDAAGLYGARVAVFECSPDDVPLPDYFADLVVSGRALTGAAPPHAFMRMLRPYGGVACLGAPGRMRVEQRGPLEGAGTWTHLYCDTANSGCSSDTLVRGPLGVLWFRDSDFVMPNRHGRAPAPLVLDGRMFVAGMDALRCVNAYNGRTLWERPFPRMLADLDQDHLMGAAGTGSNVCVTADGVYVRHGGACTRLDPATGAVRGEFAAPGGADTVWGFIASDGERLYGSSADTSHIVKWRYLRGDMRTQFTESSRFFALDARTGQHLWTYTASDSIRHNAIALGGGRVFLIDRSQAVFDRLGDAPAAKDHPPGALVALDARDGRTLWRTTDAIFGTMLALSEADDVLLMAYQDTRFKLDSEIGGRMAALRASDGARLWDVKARYETRPLINGRTIYAQPGAWDLLTGKRREDFAFDRSYGCGTISASRAMLLFRSATLGYLDLTAGAGTENYGGIRPGCWINAIPAGGLVLMPDATSQCICSYLISSSIALSRFGLRPPRIAPEGGAFAQAVTVTLSAEDPAADVHYTLDGTPPDRASPRYTAPLRVAATSTVTARAFHARMPPSAAAAAAFTIDPDVIPLDGDAWRVFDTPGATPPASRWVVENGVAMELSNHFKGDAANAAPDVDRPGTYRVYTEGDALCDGEILIDMACDDDDGIGIAFRFTDPSRHYLWTMDAQRRFRTLAVKDGESYRVLATKAEGYVPGRWYAVRIEVRGNAMAVYLDGRKDLEAEDDTFAEGRVALYAWGCVGAKYRGLILRHAPPEKAR